jgi:hypothetical protein
VAAAGQSSTGVQTHTMLRQNAAAVVAAAMLSVVIFPSLAFVLLQRSSGGTFNPDPQTDIEEPKEAL